MRLVLDTSAAISGLLWQGTSRKLIEAAIEGAIELAVSFVLIDELARALAYPTFIGNTGDIMKKQYIEFVFHGYVC